MDNISLHADGLRRVFGALNVALPNALPAADDNEFRAEVLPPPGEGGLIPTRDGRTIRVTDPAALAEALNAQTPAARIDFDHSTEATSRNYRGTSAAEGWLRDFQVAADGAITALFSLSAWAMHNVRSKTYRYLSPAVWMKEGGDITGLSSVALVNNPNMPVAALNDDEQTIEQREQAAAQAVEEAQALMMHAAERAVDAAIAERRLLPAQKDFALGAIRTHGDGIKAGIAAFEEAYAAPQPGLNELDRRPRAAGRGPRAAGVRDAGRRRGRLMARVSPRGLLPWSALRYLRSKGLRASDHWTDVWREEHAVAFTVAQMTQDELLRATRRALMQALRRGETIETFRARLQPFLERAGWKPRGRGGNVPTRLGRIYRTNLRTARAAGQWHRISRNKALLPYLVYELGPSEKHRPEHVAWAGLCLKVDDPWWNTHYPPNGWGCKCRVRQVATPPKGARRKAPETKLVEWTNPATGEARKVARGIDPGWDYHIGARRTLGVNVAWLQRCERTVGTLGADAAARMIDRHVAGPGFRWFVERPRAKAKAYWEARPELIEATPVGLLPSAAAAAMNAASRVVRLTEKVMHKQQVHHPELPAALYERLPEILAGATPRRGERVATGQRWDFDRVMDAKRPRRVLRVVVEVPDVDRRPLVVSMYPRRLKKKTPTAP